METRWELLTPPDFKRLAQEEGLCVLPIGSLERHGEHMPYGTDGLVCHEIAYQASLKTPCVVFPTYWFGQVHEASCFAGTVNFPTDLLCQLLQTLLDQIAANGFRKIAIVSGHGGNTDFLHYFAMSQLDREVPYTLYQVNCFGLDGQAKAAERAVIETHEGGHADEAETSMILSVAPEAVKLAQQCFPEPIRPKVDLSHLKNIHTGLWWYAAFPENVTGFPSKASKEKGDALIAGAAHDVAEALQCVKDDRTLPQLQREFYRRVREKG